jgi:DNA repair protein RecO (recombination protein O)
MLRITDQPAFVLHRRQYSESSLLVEALTPDHGRVGLIARGARGSRSALPALLQPFQELRLDFSGSGELQRLTRADAAGPALALREERTLAGLYCNELLVRLVQRADANPPLYRRYRETLVELVDSASVSWALRCFERDLLDALGYATDFANDAQGAALDPAGRYRFEPESGFVGVREPAPGYSGGALLAMVGRSTPAAEQLRELRRLFRELIGQHLRGEPLRSWSLMRGLGR